MSIPDPATVRLWACLMRSQRTALSRVQAALKADGHPPLAWYDVLLELETAKSALRPHELQVRLLLEQYNLSRLLDRMSDAGAISRTPDPADGRGRLVSITEAGRRLRRSMWATYGPAIQSAVGGRLRAEEVAQLVDLLQRAVPNETSVHSPGQGKGKREARGAKRKPREM